MCKMMRVCLVEQTFNLSKLVRCQQRPVHGPCPSLSSPRVSSMPPSIMFSLQFHRGSSTKSCILQLSELASKSVCTYTVARTRKIV